MYITAGKEVKKIHNGNILPMGKSQVMSKKYVSYDHLTNAEVSKLNVEGISLKRHEGSIALALAQIANGNSEALLVGMDNSTGYSPWDVAGGVALLRAKDYVIADFNGDPYNYNNGNKGLIAVRPEFRIELFGLLGIENKEAR
jgi:fructose-1,6-bisphosphatase/inositol monophosphatase family enzyme